MDMQSSSSQSQASVCGSTPTTRSPENVETTAPLSVQMPPPTAVNHPTSVPPPSVAQVSGKKRKEPVNISPMWEFFTKCKLSDGSVDPQWSTCNFCNERVLCDKLKNGTSSMWNHSKKCIPHPLYESKDPKQAKLVASNVSGGSGYHKYNKKRCDDRCIEMVIKDELPFRFVEKEGFIGLCKEMEPNWKPLNRKQIAKGVLDRYNLEKATLISQLKENQTRVSITIDTWTSIQSINYMVVTIHFLDSEWKLHKRIINFCNIISHKGEDIGRMIEQCLRQWEITKVFTITVDNASANDVAVGYMKRRLKIHKTLMFDGDYVHMRCSCHIINLIVKDGLKDLESGIVAIWNCVKFVRSSPQRLAKFREFAILEQCKANANVPLDVITRWNSTYLMLEAALKYEPTFTRMVEEDSVFKSYFEEKDKAGNKRVGPPSYDDWRNAEAFCFFLKRFYEATLKLSAWKSISANLLVEMITIQTEIDKGMLSSDPVMRRVATSMKSKFNKYWGSFESINKIIMIANVLDPRYKLQWAQVAFRKANVSAEIIDTIEEKLKRILMKMYGEYKGDMSANQTELSNEDLELEKEVDELEGLDDISREIARERMSAQSQCIRNEVDQYLSDSYVSLTAKKFDIAKWWKGKESAYPMLSKLAKDVLAIPCSTVASENAFSLWSRIADPFRASLTPTTVEALVCTADWLRAEPANYTMIPQKML